MRLWDIVRSNEYYHIATIRKMIKARINVEHYKAKREAITQNPWIVHNTIRKERVIQLLAEEKRWKKIFNRHAKTLQFHNVSLRELGLYGPTK